MFRLSSARYGKDNIRLCKVHTHPDGTQTVVEQTIRVLLETEVEDPYTRADNSSIVPTDTQKQVIYVLAKQGPISPPELFASTIGSQLLARYSHIRAANIVIVTHKWTRMTIDGKPHPHSFVRDGEDIRTVEAIIGKGRLGTISIRSGIDRLPILKSTGASFVGFQQDEYTRHPELRDRILSTVVKAEWGWKSFSELNEVTSIAAKFDEAFDAVRRITLDKFSKENIVSVQNIVYKMASQVLATVPLVDTVTYSLPNNHYFEIDLSWFEGLKNTGKNAEVFAPQTDPNGLIQCTVDRKKLKARL